MTIGFPHPPAMGGPGSFQSRFESLIYELGGTIVYSDSLVVPDAIIVVGGTRKLLWMHKMKKKGVPVLHRLDGKNWLHRKSEVGLKAWAENEIRNYLMRYVYCKLADSVVFQSHFVENWWSSNKRAINNNYQVIYNGVDLNKFFPISNIKASRSLLCVEGTLDYSPYSIDLLNQLQIELIEKSDFKSLILYGSFQNTKNRDRLLPSIDYRGKVSRDQLPEIYKDAVYLSLDVNPACPNTVIEALASGIPVVGFDSGALRELVPYSAGIIVPYGGDPWTLEFPDVSALVEATLKVGSDWDNFSLGARAIAEQRYGADLMMEKYMNVIKELLKSNANENR